MISVIATKLQSLGYPDARVELPSDLANGDLTTNVALQYAAARGLNPRELADQIVAELGAIDGIAKIEVAGPAFINFWYDDSVLESEVSKQQQEVKLDNQLQGKTVVVEHSSPNLFKPFHIGHVMNNTIGEAIVRLYKKTAATVIAVSYPSDVSLGIGKAVWGLKEKGVEALEGFNTLQQKLDYLGECYVYGNKKYEEDESIQREIKDITTELYERTPGSNLQAYEKGKAITLDFFKETTALLGSQFADLIFESEAAVVGKKTVLENVPNVFVESDGAIIYQGEKAGLHTRVFINSAGYPTYEGKDLGLIQIKSNRYSPDISVVVTDVEQAQYFKVMLAAAGEIDKHWRDHTIHVTHGRMTLRGQKMSSRLGGVMTADEILSLLYERIDDVAGQTLTESDKQKIAIAALKFPILKNAPGSSVNFDPDRSLSFEGDSGPYLQYSVVRINSILEKAADLTISNNFEIHDEDRDLVRLLLRYQHVLQKTLNELSPQYLITYLIQLAQEFNSYYAQHRIIDETDPHTSTRRIMLIKRVAAVLQDGIEVLGMSVPNKM